MIPTITKYNISAKLNCYLSPVTRSTRRRQSLSFIMSKGISKNITLQKMGIKLSTLIVFLPIRMISRVAK